MNLNSSMKNVGFICPICISDKVESITLYGNKKMGNAIPISNSTDNTVNDFEIPFLLPCLDLSIYQNKIDLPTFIKIDVDGNEMKVLRSLENSNYFKSCKTMYIEINGNSEEIEQILNRNFLYEKVKVGDNALYKR